jgi:hypothetical protein
MSRNGGKDLGDYIEEQYTGAGWNFWSRLGAEHRPQPYSGSGVPPRHRGRVPWAVAGERSRQPRPGDGMRRRASLLASLLLVLGAAGCGGGGLAGEYRDPRGVTGYEFEPGGRVFISVMGTMTAATYELDGDRVLITGPEGTTVLLRRGEELEGPMGLALIRVR